MNERERQAYWDTGKAYRSFNIGSTKNREHQKERQDYLSQEG
jgi:hypothetical protein